MISIFSRFLLMFFLLIELSSCIPQAKQELDVQSPNGELEVSFFLTEMQAPAYCVKFKNQVVIDTSNLGFLLQGTTNLIDSFVIKNTTVKLVNDPWQTVWGKNKLIENNYRELSVYLQETTALKRELTLVFKLYDDGLGFRYEFPEQENMKDVIIEEETSQFHLTNDHLAWWIPADYDSYEYTYTCSKLSEIDATKAGYEERHDRHVGNLKAVNTPLTLKTTDGLYLSFHEANLTNYAGMTLGITDDFTLQSELVPSANGHKVIAKTPFVSPWRTIQIAATAGDLIDSDLIINLNEPNQIEDVSWIKPMKYNGVWWEIHIGKSSWDYGTGIHGANTANTKRYIDFAAQNDINGVLVEGWNPGWDNWDNKSFSLTETYPDFDIDEVVRYGNEKGVHLMGHHETFGNVAYYDTIVDQAFKYFQEKGVQYVKTGYASGLKPAEYHHSQYMVNHYRKVVQLAAKYHICLNAHEPIKPTGIRRTFPNMMTREGVRGMEYNAWGGGNDPSHTAILPFTRGLAGPMDYTPGIFDIKFEQYRSDQFVRSTLAKQLALYVVLYSPLQMVADMPENYENEQALEFIKKVAVDWDKSLVLNGEIGEFITLARKDRNTKNWFVGSITNEKARTFSLALDFLDKDKKYIAQIYSDAKEAHWDTQPTAYVVAEKEVESDTQLDITLAPGGGTAVYIYPKLENE